MSLADTAQAAVDAEMRARGLAAMVASQGFDHGAGDVRRSDAETAALTITSAELEAQLLRREDAERRIRAIQAHGTDLQEDVRELGVSVEAAVASFDRFMELRFRLWVAEHRRDVWRRAVARLQELALEGPVQGCG